jgi:hypothetical protein
MSTRRHLTAPLACDCVSCALTEWLDKTPWPSRQSRHLSRKEETLGELLRAAAAYADATIDDHPDGPAIAAAVYDRQRPRVHLRIDVPTLSVELSAVLPHGSLQLINRSLPAPSCEPEARN